MAKRSGKAWTDRELLEVIDLLKSGRMTIKEVAKLYERTEGATRRRVWEEGVEKLDIPAEIARSSNRKWSQREVNMILKDLRSGTPLKVVSKKYNRSNSAIKQYLRNKGFSMKTLELRPVEEHLYRDTVQKFKLKEGKKYRIKKGDQRKNDSINYVGTCIKNYKDHIKFKKENGINSCYLKIDMMNNPEMIKEFQ